jgi:hypothetical protein
VGVSPFIPSEMWTFDDMIPVFWHVETHWARPLSIIHFILLGCRWYDVVYKFGKMKAQGEVISQCHTMGRLIHTLHRCIRPIVALLDTFLERWPGICKLHRSWIVCCDCPMFGNEVCSCPWGQ